MELRRILLRILLLALGLAAVAGVVGVFAAAGETIWRIVGTGIATAVAVGIMLPCSRMMDKQKSRAGGLGGMVWTVVAYLLVLAFIWESSSSGEALGMTLMAWAVCGLPAVVLLTFSTAPQARIAACSGIGVATGAFCLLMVWVGIYLTSGWSNSEKWWAGGMTLLGFGIPVVAGLAHAGMNDRRWWRWAGIAAAAGACLVAEAGIIRETDSLLGRQVLAALAGIAGVIGLANLAVLAPLEGMQRAVRWGTIAAAAGCAAAIVLLVSTTNGVDEEMFARAAGGFGIVAGCGSLALLVLARINRRVEYRPEEGAVLASEIAVVCPRCSKSQKIKLGGAACRTCGLRIEVTIEEPRCPKCGYLLYMLASPVCPECGTTIASQTGAADSAQMMPPTGNC